MINRAILIGRLTKDIELRATPNGKATCSFTLAVQRNKEQADFIPCVAWEKTAELLNDYTHKGSQIGAEGRIQTRSYESNGRTVYVTEVVVTEINLLDKKGEATREPERIPEYPAEKPKYPDITADDLPF